MQIEIQIKGIDEFLKKFDTRIVQKAVERTLIRTAKFGKTEISKQIRQRFNIQKQDLDRKIDVNLEGIRELRAVLRVTGEPINLTYFKPTQTKRGTKLFIARNKDKKGNSFLGLAARRAGSSGSGGVRVKIINTKQAQLKNAFISHGKGGTPLVLRRIPGTQSSKALRGKRTGKLWKREKLQALKTISYATILSKPDNIQAIENRINEKMVKELESNLDFYANK
jgi:hypothetical protein